MPDLKASVAERLKNLMEKYSLSQTEFSQKVGISKDIVSKLVNGKYSLSITNAIRISEVFGVSLDYLYGIDEKENHDQYALETLLKHFCVYKGKSSFPPNQREAYISCSLALSTLLDTLANLEDARIADDLREEGKRRAKEAFLSVISDEPEGSKSYVLLEAKFYTPEVKAAVAKVTEHKRDT